MDTRTHRSRSIRSIGRHERRRPGTRIATGGLAATLAAAPATVLAQAFGGADAKVCGFFDNVNGLLNMASIAVVTIAGHAFKVARANPIRALRYE